jgi:hypothetical protein
MLSLESSGSANGAISSVQGKGHWRFAAAGFATPLRRALPAGLAAIALRWRHQYNWNSMHFVSIAWRFFIWC